MFLTIKKTFILKVETKVPEEQPANEEREGSPGEPITSPGKNSTEQAANEGSSDKKQPIGIKKKLLERAKQAADEDEKKRKLSCEDCGEEFKLKAFHNLHKKTKHNKS